MRKRHTRKNRDIILIADDSELMRGMLVDVFKNDFEIIEAENGQEALDLLKKHNRKIAATVIDVVMPVMDGITALRRIKKREYNKRFPTFLITSDCSEEVINEGFKLGAADIIQKPFIAAFVKRRIENVINLYATQAQLSETVMLQNDKIEEMRKDMFEALVSVIDYRDTEELKKSNRVYNMTRTFLELLPRYKKGFKCSDKEINKIAMAAILHDIGKLMVPEDILTKEGKLDPDEEKIARLHTVNGAKMLHKMLDSDDPIYKYAYDICRHHHERWDGNGYPDRLIKDEISIPAQIVGIVDSYDAVLHGRSRIHGYTHDEAVEMILSGQCGAFGEDVLRCFKENADKITADK